MRADDVIGVAAPCPRSGRYWCLASAQSAWTLKQITNSGELRVARISCPSLEADDALVSHVAGTVAVLVRGVSSRSVIP